MLFKRLIRVTGTAFVLAAVTSSAFAQKKYYVGATDTEIKLGNIIPYSGPASAYGAIGAQMLFRVHHYRENRMSGAATIILAMIAAIFSCGAALAHPQLEASEPAAGATMSSPKQIRITFNEAVMPKFSGIEIKDNTEQ